MKPSSPFAWSLLGVLVVAVLGGIKSAYADDAAPGNQMRCSITFVALRLSDLRQIVLETPASNDAGPLRAKALDLVAQNRAAIAASATLLGSEGVRFRSESIVEIPYSSDWGSAGTPQEVIGPLASGQDIRASYYSADPAVRNLGLSIELDPAKDGSLWKTKLSLDFSCHLHDEIWGKDICAVARPKFFGMKLFSEFWHAAAQWIVLGVFVPPPAENGTSPPDLRLIAFLRADRMSNRPLFPPVAPPGPPVDDPFGGLPERPKEPKPNEAAPVPDPPAKDPVPQEPEHNIRLIVDGISLPTAQADALLGNADLMRDAAKLRVEIENLLTQKQARVRSFNVMTNAVGAELTRIVSGDEVMYPVHYDLSMLPQIVLGPIDPGARIVVPARPSSFGSRPTGPDLQWRIAENFRGPLLDLTLSLQDAIYLGRQSHGEGVNEVETPVFRATSVSSSTRVPKGAMTLIGVEDDLSDDLAPPAAPRRVFTFVRADLVPVAPLEK